MDLNVMAFRVVQEAIREDSSTHGTKKAAARKGGLIGGPARAKSISQERRIEIAKKANRARWKKCYRLKTGMQDKLSVEGKHMDTMALPIRELGADVTIDAAQHRRASALDVIESIQHSDIDRVRYGSVFKARALDSNFSRLITNQETLIKHLQTVDTKAFTPPLFDKPSE